MELIAYFLAVSAVSIGSFWMLGSLYGLLHRPAVYFPLSLATKMALCAFFGSFLFVVGGALLSTVVFHAEMAKRPDYKKWPVILSGLLISTICCAIMYVSVISLAWTILE